MQEVECKFQKEPLAALGCEGAYKLKNIYIFRRCLSLSAQQLA
jgi:hypothetical protein